MPQFFFTTNRSIEKFIYRYIYFPIILKQSDDFRFWGSLSMPPSKFSSSAKSSLFLVPREILQRSTLRLGECYYTNNTSSYPLSANDSFEDLSEILILGLGDVDDWQFLIFFNDCIVIFCIRSLHGTSLGDEGRDLYSSSLN